jgi:predicted AlkP superfamily phosphohydrolase/phosphomutase/Flp pilus assembly protein TadD
MPRLLLIGWDAADWKILHPLIDAGEMPTFNRLIDYGVSGQLVYAPPAIPAMEWTSIATGKRAWQHRVCHSKEISPDGHHTVSISAKCRCATTIWDILTREGKRSLVMGWPATHGCATSEALVVSDRYPEPTAPPGVKPWPPAQPGTYLPSQSCPDLDKLRVSPEEVGPDIIFRYIPEWKIVDQKRDRRIGQLRLFLAADFSYQAAAMKLLKETVWDFVAVRFPALGAICHRFIQCHLAKPGWMAEDEYKVYHQVVRGHYKMLDLMLRQLISLAAAETAVVVVSGHGVQSRHFPRGNISFDSPAWKSPYGIVVASGPGFSNDALLHGPSVLDIAPTILTWYGLPIGEDMEGRVLVEAFENTPQIGRKDSWEPHLQTAAVMSDKNAEVNPIHTHDSVLRCESDWNYAQSCLEAGRFEEALPVLVRLFHAFPEKEEHGHAVFACQLALRKLSDAEETLEVISETLAPGVIPLLLRAELACAKRDMRNARALVAKACDLNPVQPGVLRRIGVLLLRLREWNGLEKLARKALALDESDPIAWLGLAEALLRKGQPPEAAEAASRAIGLKFFLFEAHFVLGRALVAQGLWQEARTAMETVLTLQPNNRTASHYFKRMPLIGSGRTRKTN